MTSVQTEGEPSLERAVEDFWRNADYSSSGDLASCRRFIVACRQITLLLPALSEDGLSATRLAYDATQIRTLMRDAQQWLAARSRRTRYAQTSQLRRWGH